MTNKPFLFLLLIILSCLAIAGCGFQTEELPSFTPLTPSATPLPPTKTITPTPSKTPVPPTETPSPTQPPLTNTPTDTPTMVPASLLVEQPAVCRTGPGTSYSIAGYLAEGDTMPADGVVEGDLFWWHIHVKDGEVSCWIADTVVSVAGSTASVPRLTPPPTPTEAPISASGGEGIYYFLVAENTGGPFACGDSLLMIYPGIARTGDAQVDITNALNALLSNKHQYYNGLYNPMYASSLRVSDVDVFPGEPESNVWLAGDFARPKDKCDSLRMRAQVWETIEIQFPEVGHAVIRANNALLGDLLETGW